MSCHNHHYISRFFSGIFIIPILIYGALTTPSNPPSATHSRPIPSVPAAAPKADPVGYPSSTPRQPLQPAYSDHDQRDSSPGRPRDSVERAYAAQNRTLISPDRPTNSAKLIDTIPLERGGVTQVDRFYSAEDKARIWEQDTRTNIIRKGPEDDPRFQQTMPPFDPKPAMEQR